MTLPDRMTALVLTQDGFSGTSEGPSIERLSDYVTLQEIAVPKPDGAMALVKIGYANINPSDLHYIKGEYGQPRRKGVPAGFEAMGEVVALGPDAPQELMGRRVAVSVTPDGSGAWAPYALTQARALIPLGDGLRDEDGAALIVNPMSAYAMIHLVKAHGADGFVMTAGASQLGKLMASLARDEGLHAVAVVRREEHRSQLEGLGAAFVLNSARDDFPSTLAQAIKETGPTVLLDAVVDGVSGRIFEAMPRRAHWVVYGKMSPEATALPGIGEMVFKMKRIEGFWLTDWLGHADAATRQAAFETVQQRFISGAWKTDVAAILSLDEAPDQLAEALSGMNKGKILLRP